MLCLLDCFIYLAASGTYSLSNKSCFLISAIGLQYRYQRGQVIVNTARFLGYDKDDDGNLVINPEQAKVVKRIFYECLTGKSAIEIARELTKEGLKNGIGRTKWHSSGIIKILRN